MQPVDLERVRAKLAYDPETGIFTWKTGTRRVRGKVAGCTRKDGYVVINLFGKLEYGHQLAWFITYGVWEPKLDHKKGMSNRLENLRPSTQSQNLGNSNNTQGRVLPKGVYISYGKFQAQIVVNRKHKSLGAYATVHEAQAAYEKAALDAWGDYASHMRDV